MTKEEQGAFLLNQMMLGLPLEWWAKVLDIHDVHGVPFDLIWFKLQKESSIEFPPQMDEIDLAAILIGLRSYARMKKSDLN